MRIAVMGLLALVTTSGPAEESPRVQYDSLVTEFDTARKSSIEARTKATDDQGRLKASLGRPRPRDFATRFFAIAEKHPEDPVALDALRHARAEASLPRPASTTATFHGPCAPTLAFAPRRISRARKEHPL
jgi:hypothetical protein